MTEPPMEWTGDEARRLYDALARIDRRPEPFSRYTAEILWNDPHISERMLAFHLDEEAAPASRPAAFINRSAEWIISRFGLEDGRRVVDFGCGPGLYATRLAQAGARVTGIDFSKRSIRYAREAAARSGLSIDYVRQNYLSFASDQSFDLIVMIYCDFCALSPDQRKRLLTIFERCLAEDGRILLDVFSLNAFGARSEDSRFEHRLMDGFWSAGDYYGCMRTFKYEREKVVLDKYTIVAAERTWQVYNWLQYFSPSMLKQEFEAAGLAVEAVYADVAGSPYAEEGSEFAVVAKRR